MYPDADWSMACVKHGLRKALHKFHRKVVPFRKGIEDLFCASMMIVFAALGVFENESLLRVSDIHSDLSLQVFAVGAVDRAKTSAFIA